MNTKMQRIRSTLFALGMVLLIVCPALAELKVTFINRTSFEIQFIRMQGDRGSMGSDIRVVPGNFCVFTDGNSSVLKRVSMDVGMLFFAFTGMESLAGNASPALELTLDADGRPHLTLIEKPVESQGTAFDLEAGPIWNNEHAGQRCPEVLEAWLAANPGKKSVWTGAWTTTIPGTMSVCGMKLMEGEGAPAPPAVPSLINFVGTVTVLADASQRPKAEFTAIMQAGSMDAIRAMGAQASPAWEKQLVLPVSFLGKTWAVSVDSEGGNRPGTCKLRTYTAGNGLKTVLEGFAALGYRPWFTQVTAGADMDTTDMTRFWQESFNAEDAWDNLAAKGAAISGSKDPAAVDAIVLSKEAYAKAEKGEDAAMPGFRLRISSSAVIVLTYMPDISALISMTR